MFLIAVSAEYIGEARIQRYAAVFNADRRVLIDRIAFAVHVEYVDFVRRQIKTVRAFHLHSGAGVVITVQNRRAARRHRQNKFIGSRYMIHAQRHRIVFPPAAAFKRNNRHSRRYTQRTENESFAQIRRGVWVCIVVRDVHPSAVCKDMLYIHGYDLARKSHIQIGDLSRRKLIRAVIQMLLGGKCAGRRDLHNHNRLVVLPLCRIFQRSQNARIAGNYRNHQRCAAVIFADFQLRAGSRNAQSYAGRQSDIRHSRIQFHRHRLRIRFGRRIIRIAVAHAHFGIRRNGNCRRARCDNHQIVIA